MKPAIWTWAVVLCLCGVAAAEDKVKLPPVEEVPEYLQEISVLVKSSSGYGGQAEGTGVIVTRSMMVDGELQIVNFVLTAAHVVEDLRSVKEVIDPKTGIKRQVATFKDAAIVQEFRQGGRRVGEHKLDVEIEKYSPGEDLAVLRILQFGYASAGAVFYLEDEIPPLATPLYHVGCLLGQLGANSLTDGIVSQIGRVLEDKQTYDQCRMSAFPGSSGGGVYLEDGRCVGIVTRGAGETFTLMVPIRRIRDWCEAAEIEWFVDSSAPMPSWKELEKLAVEDPGVEFGVDEDTKKAMDLNFPRLVPERTRHADMQELPLVGQAG